MYTKRKKQAKHTKVSTGHRRREQERKGRKKDLQNKPIKKMAMGTCIPIITLNVKWIKPLNKRNNLVEWIQKKTHMYAVHIRNSL